MAKTETVVNNTHSKGAKDPLRSQAGLPEYFCIRLVVNFRWPPGEVASPFFSRPYAIHTRPRADEECYLNHTICHFSSVINSLAQKSRSKLGRQSTFTGRSYLILTLLRKEDILFFVSSYLLTTSEHKLCVSTYITYVKILGFANCCFVNSTLFDPKLHQMIKFMYFFFYGSTSNYSV